MKQWLTLFFSIVGTIIEEEDGGLVESRKFLDEDLRKVPSRNGSELGGGGGDFQKFGDFSKYKNNTTSCPNLPSFAWEDKWFTTTHWLSPSITLHTILALKLSIFFSETEYCRKNYASLSFILNKYLFWNLLHLYGANKDSTRPINSMR